MSGYPPSRTRTCPAKGGDALGLDELWGYVEAAEDPDAVAVWVALCRRTRRIVAWTLGDRGLQSAADLRAALPRDHGSCDPRSGFWDASAAVLPSQTHRAGGQEEGAANHVERRFGSLRARLGRLVRRAYSSSKCPENHQDAVHFSITAHNLAIKQSALG